MILHIFMYNVRSDFSGARRASEGRGKYSFRCKKIYVCVGGGGRGSWKLSKFGRIRLTIAEHKRDIKHINKQQIEQLEMEIFQQNEKIQF